MTLRRLMSSMSLPVFLAASLSCTSLQAQDTSFGDLFDQATHQPRLEDRAAFHFPKNLADLLESGDETPAHALQQLTALGNSTPAGSLSFALDGAARIDKSTVDAQLSSEAVTVVIFPGILGEFIREKAFGGVLEGTSKFKTYWERKVRASKPTDMSFDLNRLEDVSKPLGDLISAGSIDSGGRTRVRVIHLNTPRFTLESADGLETLGPLFVRRLDKVFKTLGRVPKNLVFVGYSMGTTVALDVLSRAEGQGKPWVGNVRALVSVGGVVWGSAAANAALKEDGESPTARQLALLKKLTDALEIPKGNAAERFRIRARNYGRWAKFALDIAPYLAPPSGQASPDRAALEPSGLAAVLRYTIGGALRSFALDPVSAIRDHGKNVRRWKILTKRLLAGVGNLTTEARLEWFRNHTIPTHVNYYTVAGVVLDPEKYPEELAKNSAVASGSVDYTVNLNGHRGYIEEGGSKLNDGQVSVSEARVWPELAMALNPRQKPFHEELLGVIPTHHWGLALKTGVNGTNPFPSASLLKAIAAKTSYDISASKRKQSGIALGASDRVNAVGR